MSSPSPWGPGHVIAQKFRLVQRLGQGGMGSVWAADHLVLNSQVAVKIIDPAIAQNDEARGRFLREAQAAAQLRSPHVVQTFDYGIEDGVPYIAMELLEGESLAQRLARVKRLSLEETARILTEVGRAMARAHDAGIVHRDLKPDNIYLVKNDDAEIAKVLDFGIAKATNAALGNSSQTRTGAVLGTPYYMSPEQAEGNRRVDHRTDLWSLGVIAFECIAGRKPFASDALGDLILQICVKPIKKPSEFEPVPAAVDEWFAKATQRDPAQRFQSARELTTALRAAAGLQTASETARTATASSPADGGQTSPLARTPGDPLRESGGKKLNVTTGGIAPVTHSSYGPPAQMPTPVIVAATLGALAFAGTIAFFALRSSTHTAGAASSSSAASGAPVIATASTEAPAVSQKAADAPPPPPPAEEPEAARVEPGAATAAAPSVGSALHHAPKKVVGHSPTPSPGSEKAAEKPAASKRVDFGF